jgi:regulator of protease activity HflC (stomatin/prohibitin superfamily)
LRRSRALLKRVSASNRIVEETGSQPVENMEPNPSNDIQVMDLDIVDLSQVLQFQKIDPRTLLLYGINMEEFKDVKIVKADNKVGKAEYDSEDEQILTSERPLSSMQDIIHSDGILLSSDDTTYQIPSTFPKRQRVDPPSEILTSDQNIITSAAGSEI